MTTTSIAERKWSDWYEHFRENRTRADERVILRGEWNAFLDEYLAKARRLARKDNIDLTALMSRIEHRHSY